MMIQALASKRGGTNPGDQPMIDSFGLAVDHWISAYGTVFLDMNIHSPDILSILNP